MKNFKFLMLCMFLAFTLPYTYGGCSDSGGGDDGSATGLTYVGLTSQAVIDESNAEDISGGAFATGLISDEMMGISAAQVSETYQIGNFRSVKIPLILGDSLALIDFSSSSPGFVLAATQTQSATIYGNCGGSMSYTVTVDDVQGTFDGSFTFSNFCNDGTTLNGAAGFSGVIDVNGGEFLEADFSFDNLSGGGLTLDGEINIDFSTSSSTITFNARAQDPNSRKIYWIKDYIITIEEYAGFVEIVMTGTFYHPDHGYVTLSTPDPFVLHDGDEYPTSGTLVVTGSNNSKARLTAIDNLTCTVEADVDGDDSYEWTMGTLNWEDL